MNSSGEEEDAEEQQQPITIEVVYNNWPVETYNDYNAGEMLLLRVAIAYNHSEAFKQFKGLTIEPLLIVDMIPQWCYENCEIITMSLGRVLMTLDAMEWALISTLNPVKHSREWMYHFKQTLEALRARFYYIISHSPLSSAVLDVNEDYTEPYREEIFIDEENNVSGLNEELGLNDEDYVSDEEEAEQLKRDRIYASRKIDWSQLKRVEVVDTTNTTTNSKAMKGEEDDSKEEEEGAVGASHIILKPMMTTMELIHDVGWIFYCLDEHIQEYDKYVSKKRIKERVNLIKIRKFLLKKAKDSWENTIKARTEYQYEYQCQPSHVAKFKRRSRRTEVKPKEVLSKKLESLLHEVEPLPTEPREMVVLPAIIEKRLKARSVVGEKLTPEYWEDRHQEMKDGWIGVNTDFMFKRYASMEFEKGDAVDYVLRRDIIRRLRVTGEWILTYNEEEHICPTLTAAYMYMRYLQIRDDVEPKVVIFHSGENESLPVVVDLSQYDDLFM